MNNFDIQFKWIGGSTWVLELENLKIACDPVLCPAGTLQDYTYFKAKRYTSPSFDKQDFENIDFWLLTHGHEDHIDAYGVTKIEPQVPVFAEANTKRWLKLIYKRQVDFMKWGQIQEFKKGDLTVKIEAIPCVHASNSLAALFAGSVNGYWLEVSSKGKQLSIYITGDTIVHTKVTKVLEGRRVDVLIPNVGGGGLGLFGGPYTFTTKGLIEVMDIIKPKKVLPVHHSTFSHYKEPIEKLYRLQDERVLQFEEGDTVHL